LTLLNSFWDPGLSAFSKKAHIFYLIHPEKVISYLTNTVLALAIMLRSIYSKEEIAGDLKWG
jgi:hypothetical protein